MMRFMALPPKAFDVEVVRGQAGGLRAATDVVSPGLGAADVDVAFGNVRYPVGQRGQITRLTDAASQPRTGFAAVARQPNDLQPTGLGQRPQLRLEDGLVTVAVEQDRVAG